MVTSAATPSTTVSDLRKSAASLIGSGVFPVALFALRHPLQGGLQSRGAGLGALRLGDPVDVLAPGRRGEVVPFGARLGALLEAGGEVGGGRDALLRLPLDALRG